MFYRYNFSDLEKIGIEHGEYYTMEQLKKYVPLTPFENDEDNWIEGTWFVYGGWNSCEPLDCKDKEEAYEKLFEKENASLYEKWNDL